MIGRIIRPEMSFGVATGGQESRPEDMPNEGCPNGEGRGIIRGAEPRAGRFHAAQIARRGRV